MSRLIEHYSTDGPICPNCGHTDRPDEGFYYDESLSELECGECCKLYAVRVNNSTSWATRTLTQGEAK